MSYDPPEVLADFAKRRGITFPLLSDPGSAVIRRYGLLNTTMEAGSPAYGVPFPGTFVLDRAGRVTARYFEAAYQERVTVSNILMAMGRDLARPATAVDTAHLEARVWASDDVLAPGRHVMLVVDVTPRPGMHVYAPGAEGYRIVTLHVDLPKGVTGRALPYPASEPYVFAPTNERVPVFQGPFRLAHEVLLDPRARSDDAPAPGGSLLVSGRLDYQACDDTICYNPVSVPISWALTAGALDRERAQPR